MQNVNTWSQLLWKFRSAALSIVYRQIFSLRQSLTVCLVGVSVFVDSDVQFAVVDSEVVLVLADVALLSCRRQCCCRHYLLPFPFCLWLPCTVSTLQLYVSIPITFLSSHWCLDLLLCCTMFGLLYLTLEWIWLQNFIRSDRAKVAGSQSCHSELVGLDHLQLDCDSH